MSRKANPALSAGVGYTIGNILIKGINFVMLPVFSRIMTTEEFGIYNIFLSYDAILSILIGMALHTSIKSANYKFPNKINQYTSSISLIYLGNAILLLILNFIFGNQIASVLFFDQRMLYILILYSFSNAILSLYNARISLDYSYKKYLLISFINSFGNVTLSMFFILTIFSTQKDFGRILGVMLTIFFMSIFLIYLLYKKAKPIYKKNYWKFGIKYSLPIVPHGISQVLLAQFDRIMISKLVNSSAAGIYSLAGNIKLIMTIITESISTAWSTWFYEEIEAGRINNIQVRAKQICCLFTIMSIGVLAISPELINILGGKEYEQGKYIAIPMIIDAFMLFIYNIVVIAEYYTQKTIYIMSGTVITAGINILLNYYYITKYGFIAAAYTTLFIYICYLIFHIFIAYKSIHFNVISIKFLLLFSTILMCMGILTLLYIHSNVIRYISCMIIEIPLIITLILSIESRKKK